jgi:acetyl esterase/lipase
LRSSPARQRTCGPVQPSNGTLDEFEVPRRLIADRAGILTYAIDYQLAPEAKFLVQIDEIEYFVRWLFDNADAQGATRTRSLSAATRQAAT